MVFKAGETSNPDGNNGHLKGYQRYADRAVYLQEQYTVGDIIDIVTDATKLRKLPVRDAQIMKHLANTLMGEDIRLERESLLDRIEGKPKELKEVKADMSLKVEIVRFGADDTTTGE